MAVKRWLLFIIARNKVRFYAIISGLWALINAATYCVCGELEWQTQKHCEQQFKVNYVGVVDSIRIFLPLLKSGRGIF